MYTIVQLRSKDDLASIRQRLDGVARGRVIFDLPWEIQFLARPLDFELLRREAERRQLEIAVVSPDPARRQLARSSGFPAFRSCDLAEGAAVWRASGTEQIEPPPSHWWDEAVELRRRLVPARARWVNWLVWGARIIVFLVVLGVLGTSAAIIIPSAEVRLVPAGERFSTLVPVSVDPDAESADPTGLVIPARRVGLEVEDYLEVETTGSMDVAMGKTTGAVLFTNLLAQDYVVRAGTVVRTSSSSYPVRFRTTADVIVPASLQATATVEAVSVGAGNVGSFQINQVEGAAASAVRVINPAPTSGAEPRETRIVTQEDYDRAERSLRPVLLGHAFQEMQDLLEANEFLLRESLRIEATPKRAFTRFISEQSDAVGLSMRVLVSGLAVSVDHAEGVAHGALSRRLPSGYSLLNAQFDVGEVAEEDIGPGGFTFFVTAAGVASADLDADAVTKIVRGYALAEARERLMAELPLAAEPQLSVVPAQWPRMPLLPMRITVNIDRNASGPEMAQAMRMVGE